jgi:hypothetical protein
MANPLVPLGVLNRAKASVVWASFPQLNVTISYLGQAGVSLSFGGPASVPLPQLAGVVQSPEVYQVATLRINLLKTQGLADLYKQQMETNAVLGDCTVYPDVSSGGISVYPLSNCSMGNLETLTFNGTDAGWILPLTGIYYVNNALFSS